MSPDDSMNVAASSDPGLKAGSSSAMATGERGAFRPDAPRCDHFMRLASSSRVGIRVSGCPPFTCSVSPVT